VNLREERRLNFVREQSEREVKMGDLNERDEISEWEGEEVAKLDDRAVKVTLYAARTERKCGDLNGCMHCKC
jgi:hypothetical protein